MSLGVAHRLHLLSIGMTPSGTRCEMSATTFFDLFRVISGVMASPSVGIESTDISAKTVVSALASRDVADGKKLQLMV